MGICVYLNVPYNDIVAVMPFLVVGECDRSRKWVETVTLSAVGTDNMFLMVAAVRRTSRKLPGTFRVFEYTYVVPMTTVSVAAHKRMGECMAEAAVSILITALTDVSDAVEVHDRSRNGTGDWSTVGTNFLSSDVLLRYWRNHDDPGRPNLLRLHCCCDRAHLHLPGGRGIGAMWDSGSKRQYYVYRSPSSPPFSPSSHDGRSSRATRSFCVRPCRKTRRRARPPLPGVHTIDCIREGAESGVRTVRTCQILQSRLAPVERNDASRRCARDCKVL